MHDQQPAPAPAKAPASASAKTGVCPPSVKTTESTFREIFENAGVGIAKVGLEGTPLMVNQTLADMLGYQKEELLGMPAQRISPPNDLERDRAITQSLLEGREKRYTSTKRFIHAAGHYIWCLCTITLIRDEHSCPLYFITSIEDISSRRKAELLLESRASLHEYARKVGLDALLQRCVDYAELITDSSIGFLHFLLPDEKTIHLQCWSTNTLQHMCTAQGKGKHYNLDEAGIWADCIRQRRVVVHNDYAQVARKQGLPEGHAPILRELVVPVFQDNRIIGILGVGNKPVPYTEEDIRSIEVLASMAMDHIVAKQAEEARLKTEQQLRTFLDQLPMAAFIKTGDGQLRFCNKYLHELFQIPSIEGHYTSHVADAKLLKTIVEHDRVALEQGLCIAEEGYTAPSGKQHLFETRRFAMGTDRDIPLIGGIAIDITARREEEDERSRMQERNRQLQRFEAIGTLAAGVAHELNNPLNGMINYAQLILDDPIAPEQLRDYAAACIEEGRRASGIVRNLLGFSRIDTEPARDCLVSELLAEVLELASALIRKRHLRLQAQNNSHRERQLFCRPQLIRQILLNLLINACDAVSEQNDPSRQTILLRVDDKNYGTPLALLFQVIDRGTGIEAKNLPRIFDPFFTTKGVHAGTGLGLYISQNIAKEHGGTITCKSTPGEGSCFCLELPLSPPEQPSHQAQP